MAHPQCFPQRNCSNNGKMPTPLLVNPVRADTFECKGIQSILSVIKDHLSFEGELLRFSAVDIHDFEYLASEDTRPLKSMKLGYSFSDRYLTIRMPGFAHEILSGLFKQIVDEQLCAMRVSREIIPCASPLTVIGQRAKEPDACWLSKATGSLKVVVEVGASESARQLAIDARGWVETPSTTVERCITINLTNDSDLVLEVWKLGPRVYPLRSRNLLPSALVTQHIEITHQASGPQIRGWSLDDTLTSQFSDEIRIEFDTILGRPPGNSQEADIVCNKDMLSEFAATFWDSQERHLRTLASQ
ncbi:uncharacterized protein BJX67DRAFT_344393 [Aspergillus lucknowensis]|uniref:CYTH domain-containing protein n=1 Tax=Aspergillus lucknowensis TaxID=176173 RepID=A0ABR4M1K5_9EURO